MPDNPQPEPTELTPAQRLMRRLIYWERELEMDLSPHPDPDQRLDDLIEQFLDENTVYMERISYAKAENEQLKSTVETLKRAYRDQNEALDAVKARNKALENRLTSIRVGLGIQQRQEDQWE